MYHFPNHDIYHSNHYQQCTVYADESKNPSELTDNQFEDVISHNVLISTHSNNLKSLEASSETQVLPLHYEKKKKIVARRSNVDTSNFSIEERLVAAVWVHERKHTKNSMSQIKHDFRQRFGRDPPAKNTLLVWERKLFSTGSVHDAPRTGRPINRRERMEEVAASMRATPTLSLRARALALRLPRTTLRSILRLDLQQGLPREPTPDTRLHTATGKQINHTVKKQIRRKVESHLDQVSGAGAVPTVH